MHYRTMGSTGVEVSALGMGTMRFPLEGGAQGYTSSRGADAERSIELVRHAVDAGINYFDTAFNYLHGESEKIIGRALQDGYRERALIATKSPIWMIEGADDFDRLLHKQLGRLQTDYVDVYLLHSVTEKDWREHVLPHGVVESLLAAKEAGIVKSRKEKTCIYYYLDPEMGELDNLLSLFGDIREFMKNVPDRSGED